MRTKSLLVTDPNGVEWHQVDMTLAQRRFAAGKPLLLAVRLTDPFKDGKSEVIYYSPRKESFLGPVLEFAYRHGIELNWGRKLSFFVRAVDHYDKPRNP